MLSVSKQPDRIQIVLPKRDQRLAKFSKSVKFAINQGTGALDGQRTAVRPTNNSIVIQFRQRCNALSTE
ncbi:hypothetical protein SAMN05414139_01851 [Burkholderia sp. D7]|nr:hypothetical protein SAMN05414139_01851 [Burkholderia sp. D7]